MKKQNKFWTGAGIVSSEMIAHMAMFTCALAGLIFLIRPSVRKHKKLDLKIFDLVKAHNQ